jgi:hypothetical protein
MPGRKLRYWLGAGALKVPDEVLQISEILGAGVSKALLGKAVIPDDAPAVAVQSDFLAPSLAAQRHLSRFGEPVRMYKAPPAHALTKEFSETDPRHDFARGFAIQTVIAFAKQMMAARGDLGWGMRRIMMDYNHWSVFGLLGWPKSFSVRSTQFRSSVIFDVCFGRREQTLGQDFLTGWDVLEINRFSPADAVSIL